MDFGSSYSILGEITKKNIDVPLVLIAKRDFERKSINISLVLIGFATKKCGCGCSGVGGGSTALQPQQHFFHKCHYSIGLSNFLRVSRSGEARG